MDGKRIFVFNRRILSDEMKEPQRIRLLPYDVMKLDWGNDMMKDVNTDLMKSPVLEFERYFQLQLKKYVLISSVMNTQPKSLCHNFTRCVYLYFFLLTLSTRMDSITTGVSVSRLSSRSPMIPAKPAWHSIRYFRTLSNDYPSMS